MRIGDVVFLWGAYQTIVVSIVHSKVTPKTIFLENKAAMPNGRSRIGDLPF